MNNRHRQLIKQFIDIYGGDERDVRLFSAAGRVNLIGEHIDYCGGLVMPAALSLSTVVVARKNGTDTIRLAATTLPDRVTLQIARLNDYRDIPWGDYQAGVAYTLQDDGYTIVGCDLLYDTNVPFGSGLSSSASIEVATALTLSTFSKEAGGKSGTLVELSLLSQKSENTYNGVNCGIMDQFASAMGLENKAILLNCKTLDYDYIPLELKGYALVISNCNKKRSLQDSKYNERRGECETALETLKTALPDITCLADVSEDDFDKHGALLSEPVYRRARHVVTECARVIKSAAYLREGNIEGFGQLLNASHASLRDDYEVTGKELDTLAALSQNFDGCIGARMTGAGFGGCTVALVQKEKVAAFIDSVTKNYEKAIGYPPSFYETTVERGAHEL